MLQPDNEALSPQLKQAMASDEVRIDRWLFAVRVFKSRTLASQAITGGKIKVNGQVVKPHRALKLGEVVTLKQDGRTLSYTVLGLLEKRLGAKEVAHCYSLVVDADLPEPVREMKRLYRELDQQVPRLKARPTKRDRRQIDKLHGGD